MALLVWLHNEAAPPEQPQSSSYEDNIIYFLICKCHVFFMFSEGPFTKS